jgi:hypothetical protein
MRSMRSVALVSGASVVVAVLVASPAAAERYAEGDPARDMQVQVPPAHETSPANTHSRLDIRRVVVRHTNNVVKIRVVMGALTRPRSDEWFGLSGFVKVNRAAQPSESVAWQWELRFDEESPQGLGLWVVDAEHQEQDGCDGDTYEGLWARAHYDRNWVTVIIPRRCLALDQPPNVRPRWVRVSVTTSHTPGTDPREYFDRLGSRVANPWDLGDPHFTPRLYAD